MTVPPKGYTTSVNVSFTKEGGNYKENVLCKLMDAEILLFPSAGPLKLIPGGSGRIGESTSASAAERHHDGPGAMSSFAAILSDNSLLAISALPS
ncbi:MAG: hypothetical protein J0H61_02710 [Alphaproteobacteria bacterium]|nr:hypothetical protein [Alphaproteobacteria bacterium]